MAQHYRKRLLTVSLYLHQVDWMDKRISAGEFASYSHAVRLMIDYFKTQTGKGYYTFKVPEGDKEVISRQ
jgi:hypothetical protein